MTVTESGEGCAGVQYTMLSTFVRLQVSIIKIEKNLWGRIWGMCIYRLLTWCDARVLSYLRTTVLVPGNFPYCSVELEFSLWLWSGTFSSFLLIIFCSPILLTRPCYLLGILILSDFHLRLLLLRFLLHLTWKLFILFNKPDSFPETLLPESSTKRSHDILLSHNYRVPQAMR